MSVHVVVTGAGGFVGGFIATYLAKHGFRVTATSRSLKYHDQSRKSGINWVSTDLTHPRGLPKNFDALIHCAALLPSCSSDPNRLYSENIAMACSAFNQAMDAQAKLVIFLSSMSVYGSVNVAEVSEDTALNSPGAYGKAKYDAERKLEECITRGLDSGLAIRLPGTVGRGSHHNFISDTLKRILASQQIEIRNPDSLFNNIVCVENLAKFIMKWMQYPAMGYAITNLASREPMLIKDVIALLYLKANRPSMVLFKGTLPASFLISLNKAMSLGYEPQTVYESILEFTQSELMF